MNNIVCYGKNHDIEFEQPSLSVFATKNVVFSCHGIGFFSIWDIYTGNMLDRIYEPKTSMRANNVLVTISASDQNCALLIIDTKEKIKLTGHDSRINTVYIINNRIRRLQVTRWRE